MGHFGDDLPSRPLDWCKKPVFLTNHLAGINKTKRNYNQMTIQKKTYQDA